MIIAQFKNSRTVDDKWINTFMFYDIEARLHRLGDDYFDSRPTQYQKLISNIEQTNKTSFRLHFIMG